MTDTIDTTDLDEVTALVKAKSARLLVDDCSWQMRSDGRSVRGRIVPFMEPTTIVDKGERFREQFLPGCITALIQVAQRRGNPGFIGLNFDHDESFDARIGVAANIEQLDDGGWADFRLYENRDLDKVRSMLTESHTGLSVMFDDVVPPRVLNGIRSRAQILIRHVAATPWAAYDGARVTGVRSESIEPPTLDEIAERPALAEWQSYLDTLTPTPSI